MHLEGDKNAPTAHSSVGAPAPAVWEHLVEEEKCDVRSKKGYSVAVEPPTEVNPALAMQNRPSWKIPKVSTSESLLAGRLIKGEEHPFFLR